jgi:hypothetical protein
MQLAAFLSPASTAVVLCYDPTSLSVPKKAETLIGTPKTIAAKQRLGCYLYGRRR